MRVSRGLASAFARTHRVRHAITTHAERTSQLMNPIENGPLSSDDLRVLDAVFARRRVLGRAVSLARANAWFALVSAVLCVPFAFMDPQLLLVALVLGAAGAIELRGARLWRELDPRAPKWLARNQLWLLAAIAIYCAFGIAGALRAAPDPNAALGASGGLEDQLGDLSSALGSDSDALFAHAYRGAVVSVYVALLIGCAIYQGGCAWFYASRGELLRAHRRDSPGWALALERRLLGW